jgi:hypothetical protein
MAVTTTINPGPRSTELDGLAEAIKSHPIWTELRGPVSDAFGVVGGALGAAGFGDALTGIVEVGAEATGAVAFGVGLSGVLAVAGIVVGLGAAAYFGYEATQ